MRVESVTISPLKNSTEYGDYVDVSDYVNLDGLSKIKRSIDSTDYSVGVFTFSDLKLKAQNATGIFNENDSRSIFPFGRGSAKVQVKAVVTDPQTKEIINKVQFEGLINDEATRQNITNDEIRLLVLSKDSSFRLTQIPAGTVTDGTDVKTAMISMLSQSTITNVLNLSAANINPDLNFIIDIGSELDNLQVKEGLDSLLIASNSVLLLDESDNIIVKSRAVEDGGTILNLSGRGSLANEANIISISSYNSGRQRQFNSVTLNDTLTVQDNNHIFEYGLRKNTFDFPYITDTNTLTTIGQRFVDEFKFPKIELKVRVPTPLTEDFDLLSTVKVDAPWLKKKEEGEFFPVCGVTLCGDTEAPLPLVLGSTQIMTNLKFKIISIEDDPKSFITTLKLRQAGIQSNDGVFDEASFAICGTAICGVAVCGRG